MKVSQEDLEFVESKLQKQNALLASFGAGSLVLPLVLAWYAAYQQNSNFSPIMMLVSGVVIGLAIRALGKGYSAQFSIIALIPHLVVVVSAFLLGIAFEGRIRGFILFGCYVMGAWASLHLSRLDIGRLKYKAFYQLALVNPHPSYKALKNRWFLSIPLVILVSLACSYVSIQSVLLAHSVLVRANEIQMVQEQKQRIEDKNIDIHPTALKNYDTKEALDYAYAYYSGRKISNRGRIVEDFPMSIYKSKAILKYLVDNRQNERARFILGALTEGGKGKKLVDSAAENGDEFAQYYSMLKFGCQYRVLEY